MSKTAPNANLTCPITSELFRDPVLCAGDGHTYERSAVEKWFSDGHKTSPMSGAPLASLDLVPNFLARSQADEIRGGPAMKLSDRLSVVADVKGKGVATSEPDLPTSTAPGRASHVNALVGDSELKKWVTAYDVGSKSCGPRPDQKKAYGWFDGKGWGSRWPLHRAAMRGDVAQIRALTAAGRDPNEKMTCWFDSEPLGWAASFGELRSVIALVLAGADPLRPANKAGCTPLSDAARENHEPVVRFLREYEHRARSPVAVPAAQVMRAVDLLPEPSPFEENWGLVACPVFGHPDWDKGAYHSPAGGCLVRFNRREQDGCLIESCFGLIAMAQGLPCWVGTLCYQPCGAMAGAGFPWLGDCPFTEQRVTRTYVAHAPCCLTRGPAKERRDNGLPA